MPIITSACAPARDRRRWTALAAAALLMALAVTGGACLYWQRETGRVMSILDRGNPSEVRALLEQGLSLHAALPTGETALMVAAERGRCSLEVQTSGLGTMEGLV